MAKKVDGPFVAVAVEIPEDAPTDCVPGVTGVLEVWESERKWPGKRGAFFCYPLTVEFETNRHFKTSFSYDLTMSDGIASFEESLLSRRRGVAIGSKSWNLWRRKQLFDPSVHSVGRMK